MKKRLVLAIIVLVMLAAPTSALAGSNGFDQYGYNRSARVFNGTGLGWCLGKDLPLDWCNANYADYLNDHLLMKWTRDWDRGNAENWSKPPYDKAWVSNEWNGAFPGGSGEVWHYKIIWVGAELEASPYWREGGYAVWGQFEVLMDQGTADGLHTWFAHARPSGYGGSKP